MFSRRFLTLFIAVSATAAAVADVAAQGILIPLPQRHSAVFDHSGHYLYISTSDGWVRPFNLSTRRLETGYNLGGSLNGLDIAPDDSFLLVAQKQVTGGQATVHKIDLHSGSIANLTFPLQGVNGIWQIAIAANGVALFSTESTGPLRQIAAGSNTVSTRLDAPTSFPSGDVPGRSPVRRNASGTHLLISELWPSWTGGSFIYDATTNTFSAPTRGGGSDHGALNANGTLLANGFRFSVSLDSAKNYDLIRVFAHLGAGVAFDPRDDTLFAASIFSNDIVAFDTTTFAEKFRLPVGEPVDYAGAFDVNGALSASPDGNYLSLVTTSGVRLFKIRPSPPPSGPPTFELADDMVFDHAGKYLYIATFNGLVWPYNLSTGQLESPYNLGGIINGIDIAADDSFLLAAQNYRGVNQGIFQKLDLHNGEVTNLTYDVTASRSDGSWDVAIASNGRAFATTYYGGSADTPLLQIDLATKAITVRTDAPQSGSLGGLGTQVHRSANRNRLLFLDARGSNGPLFWYDAPSDKFGPAVTQGKYWGQTSAAVDRSGNLMAWAFNTVGAHLETLPDFAEGSVFSSMNPGVAFDATRDVLYGLIMTKIPQQIVGYDINTSALTFSMSIGELTSPFEQPFDVGNLVASQDGKYLALATATTVRVFDIANKTVAALPTPTPPPQPAGRLGNISTRTITGTGNNVPIGGFIINGTSRKKVILRAMGPTLAFFGVPGALDDPTLELHDQTGNIIAFNDDWRNSSNSDEIFTARLFPSFEREAAILVTLDPGAYTAVLRGKNQLTGVALIEIYDIDPTSNSTVGNISTRGFVGSNDNVMIGGFVVSDSATKVSVRGIGPSLEQFGVTDVLQDPTIEVHNGNGVVLAFNDDWREPFETEIWNAGGPLANDREAALVLTLVPASYTAVLRGKNNMTGNGLVEVYRLQ